jgi:chromosome segregation ATPase
MNHFETVRYGLLDSEAEDELRPDVSAAYAALDRIEAEIKRLRAELEGETLLARALVAEVERLQAIIEANDNYDQDATEHEVERLRALYQTASEGLSELTEMFDQKVQEVEQLRALLKLGNGEIPNWEYVEGLEAEIANYREAFEADEKTIGELQAKVERLQEDNDRLEVHRIRDRKEIERLRAIVERLQAIIDEREGVEEDYTAAVDEVERLQAENERMRHNGQAWNEELRERAEEAEAEVERLLRELDRMTGEAGKWHDRAQENAAEVERLRAVLTEIDAATGWAGLGDTVAVHIHNLAHNALGDKE